MTGPERGPRRGLVLVGYRGTGKSTVGRILAAKLGLPFRDADAALEARAGRPIRSIFEAEGEPVFRDWEERVLAELTALPAHVLATGGGAILRESNRRAIRSHGFVVWLSAPPDVLAGRLGTHPGHVRARPALTSLGTIEEIAAVLAERVPLYEESSDLEVSTEGMTPAGVADAVISCLPASLLDELTTDRGRGGPP